MTSIIWYIKVEYEIYNIVMDKRTRKPRVSRTAALRGSCEMPSVITDCIGLETTPRTLAYILNNHGKAHNGCVVKVKSVEKIKELGLSFYY